MANYINSTNTYFKGETRISFNTVSKEIMDEIIAEQQKTLLEDLLNPKLYNDLIADGIPATTQKYIDLVEGKTYLDCNDETQNWIGLQSMLVYFAMSEYLLRIDYSVTPVGAVNPTNENSEKLDMQELKKKSNYFFNKAVGYYYDCVYFLTENYETYWTDTNDYSLWKPIVKRMKGKIYSQTLRNKYFYDREFKGKQNNC